MGLKVKLCHSKTAGLSGLGETYRSLSGVDLGICLRLELVPGALSFQPSDSHSITGLLPRTH